jgi:4-amino-4-deoxy-L-arabinose transferase-like glycosyltransferase
VDASGDFVDGVCVADAWPHTRRPLPWLFAAFLAMLFLVPFEAIHMKVHLPFSSDFDRFVVAAIVVVWAGGAFLRRDASIVRRRPRGWATGAVAIVLVAIASIVVNVPDITNLGEWQIAEKQILVLLSLVAIFSIACLTLRIAELRAFAVLIVCLAVVTAIGTVYEKKSGENIFYATAEKVLSPVAEIEAPATEVDPSVAAGRPMITGPTRHPLSVTSLLGMALPFAVVLAAIAPSTRRRVLWALAAGVILLGALITQRKAGLVIPAFAVLVLFVIRPRQLVALAPFGLIGLVVAFAVSPGLFSSFAELGRADSRESVEGRTSDYPAVVPDLLTHPALGQGFGTLDTQRQDTSRIFDNEYLGQLFQGGLLGLLAFLAFIVTPLFVVRRVLRSDDPMRGPPALAAGAGCLAFGVAAALYDIFSFNEAPYLFAILGAICVVAASVESPARVPLRRPAPAHHPRDQFADGALKPAEIGSPSGL